MIALSNSSEATRQTPIRVDESLKTSNYNLIPISLIVNKKNPPWTAVFQGGLVYTLFTNTNQPTGNSDRFFLRLSMKGV